MKDLHAAQLALEERSRSHSLAKLHEKLKLDRSSSVAARAVISSQIDVLAREIDEYLEDALAGKATASANVLTIVSCLSAQALALITLRTIICNMCTSRSSIAVKLGKQIADEINYLIAKDFDVTKKLYKKAKGKLQKDLRNNRKKAVTSMLESVEALDFRIENCGFGVKEQVAAGMIFIKLAEATTPLFEYENRSSKGNAISYIVPTPELVDFLESNEDSWAAAHPFNLPMVVPPRPWTSLHDGGYLTNKAVLVNRGFETILERRDAAALEPIMRAANKLQAVPFVVNEKILAVAKALKMQGGNTAGLPDFSYKEPPPTPQNFERLQIEKPAVADAWRAEAAAAHAHNKDYVRIRSCLRVIQQLDLASELKDYEAVYFPVYSDFRGRLYYMPNLINPAGDDLARSLLLFKEGKPLGESGLRALKQHAANCWGHKIDKASFADREAFIDRHLVDIREAVADPEADNFWMHADDPFKFLAACFELVAAYELEDPTAYVCQLPIARDGSCNGLQHWSALLRDQDTAVQVNLINAEKPADLYTTVADHVKTILAEYDDPEACYLQSVVSRATAKNPVMTIVYGLTSYGLRESLPRNNPDIFKPPYPRKRLDILAASIERALQEKITGAMIGMEYLRELAKARIQSGLHIELTLDDGFVFAQAYTKSETTNVRTYFNGTARIRANAKSFKPIRTSSTLVLPTKALDYQRNMSALPANFIHSLDAYHLRKALKALDEQDVSSVMTVHDSISVLAADVEKLDRVVRDTFVDLHSKNWLDEISKQNPTDELVAIPAGGELDINEVKDAAYFFH